MSYLVKLADGQWLKRGQPTKRIDNATIFPHPSAAKTGLTRNPGATLVPFSEVRAAWHAARNDVGQGGQNDVA
jgi:hypothetical protein